MQPRVEDQPTDFRDQYGPPTSESEYDDQMRTRDDESHPSTYSHLPSQHEELLQSALLDLA